MRIFCSICKDIFIPYSEVLVTNCGHLYHSTCITTWTGQHKTCPQCRANLSKPFRVYFDVDKDSTADSSTLEHELEVASDKLRESEREKKSLLCENKNYEKVVAGMRECAISLSKKNDFFKITIKALKDKVAALAKRNEGITQLENELKTLKAKVTNFERVETLINGSVEKVNKMIEDTPVTGLAVKQLCTYVGILKLQLHKLEDKNCNLAKENREMCKKVSEEKMKYSHESEELKRLKIRNSNLEKELCDLKTLYGDLKKTNPETKEETTVTVNEPTQQVILKKKPSFVPQLEFKDEVTSPGPLQTVQPNKAINNWEEIVCAGPSRNFGISLNKSRSLHKSSCITDVKRSNESYAFDGFGGRKKLRLGGPTPPEEFEQIKKKKEKKATAPAVQHRKIIEYCQID